MRLILEKNNWNKNKHIKENGMNFIAKNNDQ